MKRRKRKGRRQQSETQTPSAQELRVRDLNAINDFRKRKSPSLPAAARKRGTTVDGIQRRFPKAVFQARLGGKIRVRGSDPYQALVKIIADTGPVVVTAHGSRERELAGQHRAVVTRVIRGDEPDSSLKQFRGKTVGGTKLLSSPFRLSTLTESDSLGQLESLYVLPDTLT
jgi:hypothetical protein